MTDLKEMYNCAHVTPKAKLIALNEHACFEGKDNEEVLAFAVNDYWKNQWLSHYCRMLREDKALCAFMSEHGIKPMFKEYEWSAQDMRHTGWVYIEYPTVEDRFLGHLIHGSISARFREHIMEVYRGKNW